MPHDQIAAVSEDLISSEPPAVHPRTRNKIGEQPSLPVQFDKNGAQSFVICAFDMESSAVPTDQFLRIAALVSDNRGRMYEGFEEATRTFPTHVSKQHEVARFDQIHHLLSLTYEAW